MVWLGEHSDRFGDLLCRDRPHVPYVRVRGHAQCINTTFTKPSATIVKSSVERTLRDLRTVFLYLGVSTVESHSRSRVQLPLLMKPSLYYCGRSRRSN